MSRDEFEIIIKEYAKNIKIDLEKEQINRFYTYMKLLLEWNKKINLTAIVDEKEIILKHFIDSLTISKYIKKGEKLIDVGTGAGFPGIPLKIVREDIEIILLDSLNKRISFLDTVIEELELKRIKTVHSRVEDYARRNDSRETFDVAVSRAVANLSTLVEYLIPLVRVEGNIIAMKGANAEEEIKNASKAIKILGGEIRNIDSFFLIRQEQKRNNILIEKKKKTPIQYPRKAGIPSKSPID